MLEYVTEYKRAVQHFSPSSQCTPMLEPFHCVGYCMFTLCGILYVYIVWDTVCLHCVGYCMFTLYTVWDTVCLHCVGYCMFTLYTVWDTVCLHCVGYCMFTLCGILYVYIVWDTVCLHCVGYCMLGDLYCTKPCTSLYTHWCSQCAYRKKSSSFGECRSANIQYPFVQYVHYPKQ